jgi:hypothetical protein
VDRGQLCVRISHFRIGSEHAELFTNTERCASLLAKKLEARLDLDSQLR